jgi:hypothetical protein
LAPAAVTLAVAFAPSTDVLAATLAVFFAAEAHPVEQARAIPIKTHVDTLTTKS